jgi:chromate reductase, NAD(P)H dehydrogenase (quinone)
VAESGLPLPAFPILVAALTQDFSLRSNNMATPTSSPKIAVIVGSGRRESINRKLGQALVKLGSGKFEGRLVRIDDLPMFNQDLEASLPPEVLRYKDEVSAADGVLMVTPEHDRSIPALLKNAIDWGARPYGKSIWPDKPTFITGTSPGAIGTALAQQHLRSVMVGLGALLLGGEAYITFKPGLIDEQGNISDEGTKAFLQRFGASSRTASPRTCGRRVRYG